MALETKFGISAKPKLDFNPECAYLDSSAKGLVLTRELFSADLTPDS